MNADMELAGLEMGLSMWTSALVVVNLERSTKLVYDLFCSHRRDVMEIILD